jgi:hypothetical protein
VSGANTISAETIASVAREAGATEFDVRRCMLGFWTPSNAAITQALVRHGVAVGFLRKLRGAVGGPPPNPLAGDVGQVNPLGDAANSGTRRPK